MAKSIGKPVTAKPVAKKTVAKPTAKKTIKKIKVEFLKSPTGLLNLAYNAGEQGAVTAAQADILIDAGIAKKV